MKLFTPINLGPLTLKNRVVMPAMHLGYTPEGEVTDQLIRFYTERAAGGVALIIIGGCPIDDVSGMHAMVLLNDDRFIPGLTRLARAIHDHGARAATQLYQPGRYAFSAMIGGKQSIAPSAVRSRFTGEVPRAMTKDDIRWVRNSFVAATRRAKEAGFDAVEILGSAGYLISQFLSPITNLRSDEYGGSFENRMRFGLEVAEAVREAAGEDMAVIARLAGHDFMADSNTNVESAQFAAAMEKQGVDGFNITGGWHETRVPQIPMNLPRGGYVYLAQSIRQKTNVPIIACNRINHPQLAEKILRQDRADLVGVARGMIADPDWVNKAQAGQSDQINVCIGCNQGCFDHVFLMQPVNCLVNPRAGREARYPLQPAETSKNILVAGGGPAGLTFARIAAARGHRVKIFEKAPGLGGQIPLAAALPERKEFMTMIHSAETLARTAGVEIHLGREVDKDLISRESPDLVVVATGGRPLSAPFPGGDLPHVVQAWDVLNDRVDTGKRVTVVGGGAVGCEVALYLSKFGVLTPEELFFLFVHQAESPEVLYDLSTRGLKEINLIEMTGRIGSDIGQSTGWIIRQDLGRAGVRIMTNTRALEITAEGVRVEKGDDQSLIPADSVVLALGTQPDNRLYEAVKDGSTEVILIGDAKQPAKAYDAVHQAFSIAADI